MFIIKVHSLIYPRLWLLLLLICFNGHNHAHPFSKKAEDAFTPLLVTITMDGEAKTEIYRLYRDKKITSGFHSALYKKLDFQPKAYSDSI